MIDDSVGELLKYVLIHHKSIEERLLWSKALNTLRQQDKLRLNNATTKIKSAISDLYQIVGNPTIVDLMKKEIDKPDIAYYMTLTEQLFGLKEEDLIEITDLIDNHLNQKYGTEVCSNDTNTVSG